MFDIADDLAMTKAARLLRHAQIAGIHEAHELVRFAIEPDVRDGRSGGSFPELRVDRETVGLSFLQAEGRIPDLEIAATQDNMRRMSKRLHAALALTADD